ncbi:hypothetical protein FRC18_000652 [Serendipita sp. 400]|nr:hypothetical protein FRC18_000652 [Serendipita sp. 400]
MIQILLLFVVAADGDDIADVVIVDDGEDMKTMMMLNVMKRRMKLKPNMKMLMSLNVFKYESREAEEESEIIVDQCQLMS